MRFTLVILCCVFLISKHKSAEGQLIKDFFEKVHGGAVKFRQDVRKVLRPNLQRESNNNTNNSVIVFFDSSESESNQVNPASTTTIKPVVVSTPSQITKKPESAKGNGPIMFNSDNAKPSQLDFSATSTTSKPLSTADVIIFVTEEVPSTNIQKSVDIDDKEKDGKENFSGGCIPGYLRTPDGRCMPTY